MVMRLRNYFFLILTCGIFSLNSCNNDIFGLFGSNDLNSRLQERNAAHSLRSVDRNLSLGDAYSFIVLSDTHIEGRDIQRLAELKEVIERDDVKFVVFNGDITQNGKREDIETFIANADFLGVPCYPVVGNHDIYFGNWPAWKELIGSTCYRIDGDSATLLILDSANAYFGSQQLEWLERELKKTTGRVFVFSHANLFVQSPIDIQQFTDIRERARLTSMLKGRCDIMFMGHVHRRIINELGGVQYITTEDYIGNTVFCQVWVSKDNIRWEFKKL